MPGDAHGDTPTGAAGFHAYGLAMAVQRLQMSALTFPQQHCLSTSSGAEAPWSCGPSSGPSSAGPALVCLVVVV